MVNVPLKLLIAKELTTADEELLCEELDILLDEDSTVEDLAALTESSLEDERELGSNECVDDEKSELVANDKELAALDASVLDRAVLDIVLLSGEEDGL
ncbi:hypothetical protein [Cellvibrio sp. OA-2007]|uniref:hypothetical protein n=1 Tax=Cellvibrio sp. OA-2007 TaxID=529823 RepID=UPI000782F1D5|nr:hypothetical protein [Cellvibrio sp. OA-2007]